MSKIKDFLDLIRWKQVLFKNSIIAISFIFAIGQFASNLLFRNIILIILGFICLSLISASSYIMNDAKDYEKDKFHSLKKKRPIPSGRVSIKSAAIIAVILFILGMLLTSYLSVKYSFLFFISVVSLFVLSQLYSLYLRSIIFLDVIIISINFVLRALSGLFLINTPFSYWIVLCAFFLSVFMVSKKRISEIEFENIEKYRPCYRKEHIETLKLAVYASLTSILVFFCIYSIFHGKPLLLISLPVAFYLALLYNISSEEIIESESFIFTKKTGILILVWVLLIILALILST